MRRTERSRDLRGRLDRAEVVLICAVVGFGVWFATAQTYRRHLDVYRFHAEDAVAEAERLARRYGPGRHSRNLEEWVIRDFFQDRRDGVFLDVGANHYRDESNTYFLETRLGWSGIAVDAQWEFAGDYAAHRPRTRFVSYFVSDRSETTERFYVPSDNPLVASSDPDFVQREGSQGARREVTTITLDDLLAREGVAQLDFLSMDIELAEPRALAGFDIRRFRPKLVCVEGHKEVRQQLLDYFARQGYVLAGKYMRVDSQNLWFTPLVAGS